MTSLADKIITLAALDYSPRSIIFELDHQYPREKIAAELGNLRRGGIVGEWLTNAQRERAAIERRKRQNAAKRLQRLARIRQAAE